MPCLVFLQGHAAQKWKVTSSSIISYLLISGTDLSMKATDYRSKLVTTAVSTFLLGAAFADDYNAPRTQWEQPDIQGVWNFSSNTPMERPAKFGDRQFLSDEEISKAELARANFDERTDSALPIEGVDESYNDFWIENAGIGGNIRTSHIVNPINGKLPAFVAGAIRNQGMYGGDTTGESRPVRIAAGGIGTDGPEDRGLSERCIVGFNAGPPFIPSLYNNNVQIVQHKTHVVLLTEMIHDARVVKLFDDEASIRNLDDSVTLWTGDSRGYWEGESLIVITQNFNGLTASFGSSGTSSEKILTERFTRISSDTVNYEFTVDDPATYTATFSAIVPMTKVAGQLYEYACHEGNYGMVNILRGARVQDSLATN